MGAVTPGETLGTLYNIHVGSNKTKQHTPLAGQEHSAAGPHCEPPRIVVTGHSAVVCKEEGGPA